MKTELRSLAAELEQRLEGLVENDRPLARLTTYRLGGPAALYVEPRDAVDLEALGATLREAGPDRPPVLVLGRGSNLVVSDRGWPGLVLRLGPGFTWVEASAEVEHGLSAGGAKPLPLVANWAARRSLSGMEWAVGVPGSVGGAVRMNAGAHGGDMARCVLSVGLFDLERGTLERRDVERLDFSYRHSSLESHEVVVDATLQLTPADPAEVRKDMEAYRRHRAETQPGALQNAGSTFKNPPGDSAGRLVEAAGLKGFRVGGASVSEIHANFFMASEEALAQDIFDLVAQVRERVRDTTGIDLQPEVRFAGPFDERVETVS
ncbi:MAG: UDP-N-acetylmuramate dehydrogenase [Actinomycetota bacterium]